ncbi:hypothetical protein DV702_16010 [Sporosarcina sp. PTS2304]|nr:hypothetical protein DV702_16010 [Sporosarcina sp. PTS2304]
MLSRIVLSLKIDLVLISLFSCILIIYCSNPYVINPTEFILYTKYFIPVGFFVWLLASFRFHLLITKSTPLKWLAINELIQKPIRIVIKQISVAFICFLTLQILIAGIIASVIVINFSSGFDLFKLIFVLYLIYFALPFIWSWFTGLFIGIIYTYYSHKKAILFFGISLLWIVWVLSLEYELISFSIFIENRWPYIDPLYNLTTLKNNVIVKLIYLTCSIGVCFVFIKIRRSSIGFTLSAILIIFVSFTSYNVQSKSWHYENLLANDYKLYQQIKDKVQDNIKMTDNWRVMGIKIEAMSQYPIQIELTIDEKADVVRFSINEQFSIAQIESDEKNLAFEQQGSIVEVEPNGAQSMILYYKNTVGTSFYPLMSNAILLPFSANWYPQPTNLTHYTIDPSGNFHVNFETRHCEQVEIVFGEEDYSWEGDNLDCLSIIKGAYKQIEIQEMKMLVYQPFLTRKKNYIELQDRLVSIRSELCNLFNNLKDGDYCEEDIQTITIIPKSLNENPLSLYDGAISNGNFTFYVNPFLDVNHKPVTAHIEELSTFLIPYRLLEEEQLSYFISLYLIEKLDIESFGYLEWVMEGASITSEEWSGFAGLTIEEKEKELVQMATKIRRRD